MKDEETFLGLPRDEDLGAQVREVEVTTAEIPGGQRAPELYDKSKILKLEAEAQKLREMIDKKEDAKRQKLREWDSLEREADTAQLRVDLAEGSLRSINGEADVSDAF
ncbi:uncharacterized protein J4E79_004100 [Alternaria viburni]|uniref:uncharacterized protein n=1 Tax=Alternaria viburni TaxID=566460 RepID=UPI0020C5A030|nr:uncharacterized protein J4E79_004100 [Alternaria viburni]KAI4662791.1 hypothetical protein J4E79_004100 [Alternaria viburni]